MKKLLILCTFLISVSASAWDGVVPGVISAIHITGGNNYDVRVYLAGTPKLCGNEHNWAYLNETDANYNVFVSSLLAAKATGDDVILYSTRKNDAADGLCRIGYLEIK
jgi:hypothetical protein